MERPNSEDSVWALIEHTQDAIIVIDEEGTIEFVNQAIESILGYTPEELEGSNAFDHVHEDNREDLLERFSSLIEQPGQATDRVRHRMYHRDGSVRWVESVGSNQRDTRLDGFVINTRDITASKRHESALEDYKEYTESIFDSFEDGFFVMDTAANIVRWNRRAKEVTGYTDAEFESMNATDFIADEQIDVIAENLQEALETGTARFEADLVGKDGDRIAYEFVASRLENPDGETVITGLGRDISQRKQRERELRRLRGGIEASAYAVYITDADGRIEYVNPAFEEITGFSEAEALGANPRILQSGEMAPGYYEDIWETINAGQVWEEEIINHRQNGDAYTARQTIAPITDATGEIDGFVAIQTDITEEKERIEQLETFRQAIESTTELIAAVDADYQYLFANDQYLRYHDIEQGSIEGITVPEVFGVEEWSDIKPLVDRVLAGDSVRYQMTRAPREGLTRYLDIHYNPLREVDSTDILGVVATIRDVTDLQDRQRQLIVLSRVLRHNLHNDMNVIRGHAELIRDRSSGEIEQDAERIISKSDQLLETTDKTRDITRIFEGGHHQEVVEPDSLLSRLVEETRERNPGVAIETAIRPVSSVIASDKLGIAVSELVANAIAHNDAAEPVVEVATKETDEAVKIQVSDNGPGIPEMERKVLEEDRYEEPLYHGSGLGLWLVYWIVRESDGVLEFKENEPRGSVVTIRFPK